MSKKNFFVAVLAVFACFIFIYSLTAFYKVYRHSRLQAYTPIENIEWSVKSLSEEQFVLEATYPFQNEQRQTLFDRVYRNPWAAQQAIKQNQSEPWILWYDPSNFSNQTLHKVFPTKNLISAFILIGLLFYFILFGKMSIKPFLKD